MKALKWREMIDEYTQKAGRGVGVSYRRQRGNM